MTMSRFRLTAGELLSLLALLIVISFIAAVLLIRSWGADTAIHRSADSCDSLTTMIEVAESNRNDSTGLHHSDSKKKDRKKNTPARRLNPVGRNYLDESADE